jgi:hypothetical protein
MRLMIWVISRIQKYEAPVVQGYELVYGDGIIVGIIVESIVNGFNNDKRIRDNDHHLKAKVHHQGGCR